MAAAAAAVPGQEVTATARVEIDGRVENVRKINGRWSADDNRQLTPQKDGFTWYIGEKGKTWTFHHHHPVNLQLAESLHLSMTAAAVEHLLGEPNETAGRESTGSRGWMYYAADGTAVSLHFIHDELAVAKYERADYGVAGKPVQSVAQELGGRDVFKVMADRAWQRGSQADGAERRRPRQGARVATAKTPAAQTITARAAAASSLTAQTATHSTTILVPDSSSTAAADPPQRRIAGGLLDSIKQGMSRPEVVRILGEPSGGMHVAGGENDVEVMTYALEAGGEVSLRLEQGSVMRISR